MKEIGRFASAFGVQSAGVQGSGSGEGASQDPAIAAAWFNYQKTLVDDETQNTDNVALQEYGRMVKKLKRRRS